jgi:hypothetical protein
LTSFPPHLFFSATIRGFITALPPISSFDDMSGQRIKLPGIVSGQPFPDRHFRRFATPSEPETDRLFENHAIHVFR